MTIAPPLGLVLGSRRPPPRPAWSSSGVAVFACETTDREADLHLSELIGGAQTLATDERLRAIGSVERDVVGGFFANGGEQCRVLLYRPGGDVSDVTRLLRDADDVDLVAAPRAQHSVRRAILDVCERRSGLFAILDGPGPTDPAVDDDLPPSPHAALYEPWLRVDDRAGGTRAVPPSGHVAGLIAKLDRSHGTHRAPANVPLEGVVGTVPATPMATANPIRSFPGRGTRPMGARTLAGPSSPWRQVNVRRTFDRIARYLVDFFGNVQFEANDPSLWIRVTREVEHMLFDLFATGAFQGDTPAQSFAVRCDSTTNTPERRALGQLVAEVTLSLAEPAETITVHISASVAGVEISAPV